MILTEALDFLKEHQPMPPTAKLNEDVLRRFETIRAFLEGEPNGECLGLLLSAFGEGDGHGVYQLVAHTALSHRANDVIPLVIKNLRSPHKAVRHWNAEIAANYSGEQLARALGVMLHEGDKEDQLAAVFALCTIGDDYARHELIASAPSTSDVDVKEAIRVGLSEW